MAFIGVEKIPNQTGFLIINEDGGVISSGGDLENDEHVASTIVAILQAVDKSDLIVGDKNDPLQKLSITYDDHFYAVSLSNKKIHVVKRKYIPVEPIAV